MPIERLLLRATVALALPGAAAAQCLWKTNETLTPAAGYGAVPQYFARDLALDGSMLLVGSPGLDGSPGEAQLFAKSASGWLPDAVLPAPAGSTEADDYGRAVALHGDVAAVGAPLAGFGSGAVSIFERGPSGWLEAAQLAGPAGDSAAFGAALALHGDLLLVGAPGSELVHVFERLPGGWIPTVVLAPSGGEAEDFGAALDFDGARAVVGAPDQGEALIFDLAGGAWTQTARLAGLGLDPEAEFGTSVALAGDLVVVGAAGDDEAVGAVLIFRKTGAWAEEAKLAAPAAAAGSEFGSSLALEGELLAVGAPGDEQGLGSVYVYLGAGGAWFAAKTLSPYDYLAQGEGQFGSAVALDGPLLVASIGLDETGLIGAVGPYAGAAQSWTAVEAGCPPLLADTPTLSASAGGCQSLLLHAGADIAPHPYLVLGSASGTLPGVLAGSTVVPLNPDPYFQFTLTHPNGSVLQGTFGVLSVGAPALAAVCLPPTGSAVLVGLALHHAFVGIDPALPGMVAYASNPSTLAILP